MAMNGLFNTEARVLAATTPTIKPPSNPGPAVAATASISLSLILALFTAVIISLSITVECDRAAISGITPPDFS